VTEEPIVLPDLPIIMSDELFIAFDEDCLNVAFVVTKPAEIWGLEEEVTDFTNIRQKKQLISDYHLFIQRHMNQ
jgi:hypothetical protein